MTWEVFGAFVVTSLILAVAPGPDNLFVLVQSAVVRSSSISLVSLRCNSIS